MVTYVRPATHTPVHVEPTQGLPGPDYGYFYRGSGLFADPNVLRIRQLEEHLATLTRRVEDQAGMISGLQQQLELQQERIEKLERLPEPGMQLTRPIEERHPEPYEQLVFITKDGRRVKVTVQDA
jgi:TolA-binding protein